MNIQHTQISGKTRYIQRQTTDTTNNQLNEIRLHQMAIRPSLALGQWNKLKQDEKNTILWKIMIKYGSDFATDFLNYAKGIKKADISVTVSNSQDITTEVLNKKGFRDAGTFGGIPIWVHPSGREVMIMSRSKDNKDSTSDGMHERCDCIEKTDTRDECYQCCNQFSDEACNKICRTDCKYSIFW